MESFVFRSDLLTGHEPSRTRDDDEDEDEMRNCLRTMEQRRAQPGFSEVAPELEPSLPSLPHYCSAACAEPDISSSSSNCRFQRPRR